MSIPVLVAVEGDGEARLVAALERSGGSLHVARRCADLAELVALAAAGLGRAAVVSAGLHRLDRQVVAQLGSAAVAVVGVCDPARSTGDGARLAALGVSFTLSADSPAEQVVSTVSQAVASVSRVPDRPGSGIGPAPGQAGADGGKVPPGGSGSEPGPQPPNPGGGDSGRPVAEQTGRQSRIVAVWGPAGAPGRSTVAVTLAAELASLATGDQTPLGSGGETSSPGGTVLLVDADTYSASIAQMLGLLDESAGLAAAVRAGLSGVLDGERLARLAPHVVPGLAVLTGLPRSARWPELKPAGLDVVWERAREIARWVVVDCGFCLEGEDDAVFDTGAQRNGATLSALHAADIVVVVGAADPVGLQRLVRGLADLAEVSAGGRRDVVVVVTRVRASAVGPRPEASITAALSRFAGVQQPVLVPEDRDSVDAALLAGRSLTEHAPGSPARRAIAALAAELAGVAPIAARRRRAWRRS